VYIYIYIYIHTYIHTHTHTHTHTHSIVAAVFSFAYKCVYQFACTELTVRNNSEGYKSLQNFFVVSAELVSCHLSDVVILDVASRFLE